MKKSVANRKPLVLTTDESVQLLALLSDAITFLRLNKKQLSVLKSIRKKLWRA